MTFGSTFGRTFSPTFQSKSQASGNGRNDYANLLVSTFGSSIISYLPLWESTGMYADDYGSNGYDGLYSSNDITLAQDGIGDGRTSISKGTASHINWLTTALASAFNGAEGTVMLWAKVSAASNWTDGIHRLFYLTYNASNNIQITKTSVNGRIEFMYTAGGTQEQYRKESMSTTNWMCLGITWSKSNDRVKYYLNGTRLSTSTVLGTWTGTPSKVLIGGNEDGSASWVGNMAHVLFLNREATEAEMATVATLPKTYVDSVAYGTSRTTYPVADGASIATEIAKMRGGDILSLASGGTYTYPSGDTNSEFFSFPSGNSLCHTEIQGNGATVSGRNYAFGAGAAQDYYDVVNLNLGAAKYWSLFITNASYATFTDCTFYNPASGSSYDVCRIDSDCHYITFTRCTATSTTDYDSPRAHDGFEIWGPCSNITFTDCKAYNIKNGTTANEGHGFEVYGQLAGQIVDAVTYHNCEAYNCQVGFSVEGGPLSLSHTNIVCDGCSSHDNAFYGYQGIDGSTLYRTNVSEGDNSDNAVSETYGNVTDI